MPTIIDKAQEIAVAIDHVMMDELRLQPPLKYQLLRDGKFILVIAVMDEQNLRGSIRKYVTDHVLHQLSTAIGGLPVVLSNHSGVRYAVSLTGKPRLPKIVDVPEAGYDRDVNPFGVNLRGSVHLHWSKIVNIIIGGSQSSGKSMALRLIAHAARRQGSKLYLVDPVSHTFNPDVWNGLCAAPVAGTRGDVLGLLDLLEGEIEARMACFRQAAVKGIPPEDIDDYNKVTGETLPRVHLIGDEMNTYLSDRLVRDGVAELARKGRKWGVHVTMAAHNWRAEDISRGLSNLFPTRLCLRVADDTSGNVTLSSYKWGQQAMKIKQAGRAVLLANGHYQKVQMYHLSPERERAWLGQVDAPRPLPDDETRIVLRAITETSGKMTQGLLMGWGLSDTQARDLAERYEARGWLAKDARQGNARFVTEALRALVVPQKGEMDPNQQTAQTAPKPSQSPQSGPQTPQTNHFSVA